MRGVKAKKLRRFAVKQTGRDTVTSYMPLKPVRIFEKTMFPGAPARSAIFLGQVTMNRCTRQVYQGLKKMYKAAPAELRGMR